MLTKIAGSSFFMALDNALVKMIYGALGHQGEITYEPILI